MEQINSAASTYAAGQQVRHNRSGLGTVMMDSGQTVVVRFGDRIEECRKLDLQLVDTIHQRAAREIWDVPYEVISRTQAECIFSVNDTWGIFSRSRIELLPHQLWVCRRVNADWPARWLVADDVGLGKTIEAGMILLPLITRNTVRRLLILCPASLVEQWQERLLTMFDIHSIRYNPEIDTPRSGFWSSPSVIASMQTLRTDHNGRQARMLQADPWDLVIVDEAHHLNWDERNGQTLAYQLVRRLSEEGKIDSMIFFTGTPHRGKDFGFLALLSLLKPGHFDPKKPLAEHLAALPDVMIRNNKSSVTDLQGRRLFQPPIVRPETYSYSAEEARFYNLLTNFIATGRAYASGLSSTEGRAVMLVLIAMQKLASSSVAAIRRALRGRLKRIKEGQQKLQDLQKQMKEYEELEQFGSFEQMAEIDECISELSAALRLMEDEEPAIQELLAAADAITEETKIKTIVDLIDKRYDSRSVLLFTEYKATQSLLMSALIERFGSNCVTFINGDNRAEDVRMPSGELRKITEIRENAGAKFNQGQVRFLVSTEAGGEGIDLQERCYTLFHVDLPWNPMRLHQRVGRLNRYGQTKQVEVLNFRNPDTVEYLIWEKLNEKLERINLALGQAMDEPEDMLQIVLGMTSPSLFRNIFAEGSLMGKEGLSQWFDQETSRFGGQDVVEAVKQLVGHVSKFEYHQVSELLPRVDLPDLQPFFELALSLNGKRIKEGRGLSFLTPDTWKNQPGVTNEYQDMIFDRFDRSSDAQRRLLGVGHMLVDTALEQSVSRDASVAIVSDESLSEIVVTFKVRDRVTTGDSRPRPMVVGILVNPETTKCEFLTDWQLLKMLNAIPLRKPSLLKSTSGMRVEKFTSTAGVAEAFLAQEIHERNYGFEFPIWEIISVLCPQAVSN